MEAHGENGIERKIRVESNAYHVGLLRREEPPHEQGHLSLSLTHATSKRFSQEEGGNQPEFGLVQTDRALALKRISIHLNLRSVRCYIAVLQ